MNPTKQDPTYREAHVAKQSLLSPREREVLILIGQGLKTGEIAKRLFRSIKTIESHRANIKEKLNLDSHISLVAFAVRYVIEHVENQ